MLKQMLPTGITKYNFPIHAFPVVLLTNFNLIKVILTCRKKYQT